MRRVTGQGDAHAVSVETQLPAARIAHVNSDDCEPNVTSDVVLTGVSAAVMSTTMTPPSLWPMTRRPRQAAVGVPDLMLVARIEERGRPGSHLLNSGAQGRQG